MPNNDYPLTPEEREVLDAYERGEYKPMSMKDLGKETIELLIDIAKEKFKKNKTISLRLSEPDLVALKRRAQKAGMPYQTLITTLIKQFVNNKIKVEL